MSKSKDNSEEEVPTIQCEKCESEWDELGDEEYCPFCGSKKIVELVDDDDGDEDDEDAGDDDGGSEEGTEAGEDEDPESGEDEEVD